MVKPDRTSIDICRLVMLSKELPVAGYDEVVRKLYTQKVHAFALSRLGIYGETMREGHTAISNLSAFIVWLAVSAP